jgi:acetyl-CoA C-acetyltransferase
MNKLGDTPVIVAVGQSLNRWDGENIDRAPGPASMSVDAARAALYDSDVPAEVARTVDCLAIVRANQDSVDGVTLPFGRCANPPATVAHHLGLRPRRVIHSAVGGDQPQALVNGMAEAIFRGDCTVALIAGGEAVAAAKLAQRRRLKLDWSAGVTADLEDRDTGEPLLSGYEIKKGLGMPIQTYPHFEHAWRTRHGLSRTDYTALISQLWSRFSAVAAANPFAQFPSARSADFLASATKDNYVVADPYLKWHVAQDAVNQGAALVMTSVRRATELGIPERNWVYLHGYARVSNKLVSERSDLSRSKAMELVLASAPPPTLVSEPLGRSVKTRKRARPRSREAELEPSTFPPAD